MDKNFTKTNDETKTFVDADLVLCAECGNKVRATYTNCPTCGAKIQYQTTENIDKTSIDDMLAHTVKRSASLQTARLKFFGFIAIILVVSILIIILVAISKTDNDDNYTDNTTTYFDETTEPSTTTTTTGVSYQEEESQPSTNEYNYNLPGNIEKPKEFCDYKPMIVKAEDNLIMRTGPNTTNSKIDSMANKSLVYVIGYTENPKWSLVYYRYYDKYGWANNSYLKTVDIATTSQIDETCVQVDNQIYQLTGSNHSERKVDAEIGLILRGGPSADSKWILRMEYGDTIVDLGRYKYDSDWAYVEYNDGINKYYGFANAKFFS